MIYYQVSFPQLASHYLDVQLNVNCALSAGQKFNLPDWIPGSYMIRDFSKNLSAIRASCKGEPVRLKKNHKSEWELLDSVACLQLNYQVYARDLSVRSAHADLRHVFFNGSSLFLAVEGKTSEAYHLKINRSALINSAPGSRIWTLATSMPAVDTDAFGFGHYRAEDYASLIDHPVEIAELQSVEFAAAGVPHKMVFTEAPANIDLERIAKDVQAICETEIAFWGDQQPPFSDYLFMTLSLPNGFGGLEHRSSTALHCSHKDLPLITDDKSKKSAEYRQFLSLCCHEYFHSWNVKRLKPSEFIQMDLSKEVHSEMLWFFEGITSYYDELLMPRAGVISGEDYLDMLAKNLTRVSQGQGQQKQTLAESSFDAWTKFYKQDENAANAIVSYYTKGAMAAMRLDFEIRQQTYHQNSLDDLMRHLWQHYGKKNIGISESSVLQAIKECFALDLSDLFQQLYHSTNNIDLTTVFNSWNVIMANLPNKVALEKGGFSKEKFDAQSAEIASLGIRYKKEEGLYRVVMVHEHSTASDLGLSAGDDLVALDQMDMRAEDPDQWIGKKTIGQTIAVSFFRRGRLCHASAKLKVSPVKYTLLSFDGEPSELFQQWLSA